MSLWCGAALSRSSRCLSPSRSRTACTWTWCRWAAGASRRWTDSLASANARPTTMNRLPAGARFSSIAAAAPGKPGDYRPLYLATERPSSRVLHLQLPRRCRLPTRSCPGSTALQVTGRDRARLQASQVGQRSGVRGRLRRHRQRLRRLQPGPRVLRLPAVPEKSPPRRVSAPCPPRPDAASRSLSGLLTLGHGEQDRGGLQRF